MKRYICLLLGHKIKVVINDEYGSYIYCSRCLEVWQ